MKRFELDFYNVYSLVLRLGWLLALSIWHGIAYGVSTAPCDDKVVAAVLEPARKGHAHVNLSCSLTLRSDMVITKRLVLEGPKASGVQIDCNGATFNGHKGSVNAKRSMIEVISQKIRDDQTGKYKWLPPKNITIDGCYIKGAIRVRGIGRYGGDGYLKELSRQGRVHTDIVRQSAPSNIILQNMVIEGDHSIPIYFSPGVNHSHIINSELKGKSISTAIYFDAESYKNSVRNNYIHVKTKKRELVAIDGSSHNVFINNRFSSLSNGGVYLYRNCGENGAIRYSTPSYNQFINNTFYYKHYSGNKPAIYLGSRNGSRSYCDKDRGYPWGSSQSNLDYAAHNVIMQNQFYKHDKKTAIRIGSKKTDKFNLIAANRYKINKRNELKRNASCFVEGHGGHDLLPHGKSVSLLVADKKTGVEETVTYQCVDGILK